MPTKRTKPVEEINEADDASESGTAAAQSLQMKPSAASDTKTKSAMMSQMIDAMAGMDHQDLSFMLQQVLDQVGKEADSIPDGTAEKNQGSVSMRGNAQDALLPFNKTVKEDVVNLFGSMELSEEFEEKAVTLFEAALTAKVIAIEEEIKEAYVEALSEEVEEILESVEERVDRYLSFVAEEWAKENEIAIESSLKSQLSESFINEFLGVCERHYFTISEDKVEVVEALADRVEELENDLNEQVSANIELVEAIEQFNSEEIFDEVSEGLAMTQIEKFRNLTESVEYDSSDEDAYRRKLETIKESFFTKNPKAPDLYEEVEMLTEEEETGNGTKHHFVEPQIARYMNAISKTVKK